MGNVSGADPNKVKEVVDMQQQIDDNEEDSGSDDCDEEGEKPVKSERTKKSPLLVEDEKKKNELKKKEEELKRKEKELEEKLREVESRTSMLEEQKKNPQIQKEIVEVVKVVEKEVEKEITEKDIMDSEIVQKLMAENEKLKARENELKNVVNETKREREIIKEKLVIEVKKISDLENEKLSLDSKIFNLELEKESLFIEKEKDNERSLEKQHELNAQIMSLENEKSNLSTKITHIHKQRVMSMKLSSSRANILREFYMDEKTYLNRLVILQEYYFTIIRKKKIIGEATAAIIFQKYPKILEVTNNFLKELEKVLLSSEKEELLANLVLNFCKHFEQYNSYVKALKSSSEMLQKTMKKSKKFRRFLDDTVNKLKAKKEKVVTLSALMLVPLLRLPAYKKLLEDVSLQSKKESEYVAKLKKSIKKIEEILVFCNENSAEFSVALKVIEVNEKLGVSLDPLKNKILMICEAVRVVNNGKDRVILYVFDTRIITQLKNEEKTIGVSTHEEFKFQKKTKHQTKEVTMEIIFTTKKKKLHFQFDDVENFFKLCELMEGF